MSLFKIRHDERWVVLFALVLTVALNALVIYRYYGDFTPLHNNYFNLFVGRFRVSGFDPLTYYIVSHWEARYNVYRHPLLAFMMWVPYLINQVLMWLFGINFTQFIVAVILVFCATYSFLFLYRILRDLVCIDTADSFLLSIFLFSFAYIMLSSMVPDHFIMSMFMLLLTLYVSGMLIKQRREMSIAQGILMFVITAGISLNNGLKVFLAGLFTNGKRFFHPAYLVMAVILPALLMWGFCRWEYKHFVWEGEQARHAALAKKKAERKKREARMDSLRRVGAIDSVDEVGGVGNVGNNQAHSPLSSHQSHSSHITTPKQGRPIAKGEFMRWTDITTPRWDSAIENLFGEAIQLHTDYLLQDEFRSRPMIVRYHGWVNYAIEALIVLLFLYGIICGWRSRFLWLCLSFFLMDMALHVGLGFGINEVYIMSAHYIYVIPIAIGYLFKALAPLPRRVLRGIVALLTLYLFIYNGYLIITYFV
ncbi:MAG: GtrA family protein [Prevotella sp.]|nr:GtrA family protein [Prevotella sp.]